jgi:selenocysteine lyase/cysteine desulfurase
VLMPSGSVMQGAHVSLADADPQGLATWLSKRAITVSPRGPVVRLSFHFYNKTDDIDMLCTAIGEYRLSQTKPRRIFGDLT